MRSALAAIALASLLLAAPAAQDVNQARQLLEQALRALQPAAPPIATPEALDEALAAAAPGAVLTLSPTLVYPRPLAVRQAVTLEGLAPSAPRSRMDRATPLPRFTEGLTIGGDDVTLVGLEVRHSNPLTDIVTISGARVTLDRVRVLGDPVKGAKRGIASNGNGDVTIVRSYVDDAFQSYPGNDSQAICSWDMGPGLTIEDNYLSAGSETIMLGGADASADRTPTRVRIRGNTITKNPAWQPLPIGVKNTLEIKNARDVVIEDNDISYSWGGHGQDGYLLVLTVRNQDGRAPWATIQDVTIRGNRFAHGAAGISVLGLDTIKETRAGRVVPIGEVRPSVRMARVTIAANTFTDLNPKTYTGSNKLMLIDQAPEDLTIEDNTFVGSGFSSVIYFAGGGPAARFTFTNNRVPPSTYGLFGMGVTAVRNLLPTNPAWVRYTQGGTIAMITVQE